MARAMIVLSEDTLVRHCLLWRLPLPDELEWQGRRWRRDGRSRYIPIPTPAAPDDK